MGSSDSKLGKVLEEEFPGTERYYGFYNVRGLVGTFFASLLGFFCRNLVFESFIRIEY